MKAKRDTPPQPNFSTANEEHNLRRFVKIDDMRGLMGIVYQKSILFNDTVFNNIAFGSDVTKEEVIQAAKIANAHEFIDARARL